MTSYQMLKYVLWLRGKSMQYNDNESEIKFWLQNMDIKKYSNVKAANYSGGTKRKLSTALAMVCFELNYWLCKVSILIICRLYRLVISQL